MEGCFLQPVDLAALSGSLVSVACDQNVEYIAVVIDRAPEVTTLDVDGDEDFVEEPRIAWPFLLLILVEMQQELWTTAEGVTCSRREVLTGTSLSATASLPHGRSEP